MPFKEELRRAYIGYFFILPFIPIIWMFVYGFFTKQEILYSDYVTATIRIALMYPAVSVFFYFHYMKKVLAIISDDKEMTKKNSKDKNNL